MTTQKTLMGVTLVVALSTIFLIAVRGYGTVLYQCVVLGGYVLVAFLTSEAYAEQHAFLVWAVILAVNVICFFVPALFVFFVGRKWSISLTNSCLVIWLALYLGALFVLFPATDGP